MMICPRCMRQFDDEELTECPDDGARLRSFKDQTSQLIGTTLDGRWQIEEKIGEGGMGEVYRATQVNVDRTVAVKVLRLALASSEEYVARFFREADIATSVEHPHFVSIYDFGQTEDNQLLYIAMELLRGEPLSRVLRTRRVTLEETLTIAAQAAAALAAAHEARIVHRDLKPDNIFLLDIPEGGPFVKVLDFGIAKHLDSDAKVTRTGQLFGTPEYMSPEQCEGSGGGSAPIDGRSDLYALGCILYEILTGRSPFQRATIIQTLVAQVGDEAESFSELGIPVPAGVQEIVFRLLEKHPDNRFASAMDARRAILDELARLRKNSGEIRAFETVSKNIPPRDASARTVSYSELGHPLQLEGVLAESARSAIAKRADARRQQESERETENVEAAEGWESSNARKIAWAVVVVFVAGFIAAYSIHATDERRARALTADGVDAASGKILGASQRAVEATRREAARVEGRRAGNLLTIMATSAVLTKLGREVTPPSHETRPATPAGDTSPRELLGVRTQTSMNRRFRLQRRDLLQCYARRADVDDGGAVKFELRIDPDGTVSAASVTSAELKSQSVLDCMKSAVSTIRFAPADGGARLSKTLTFGAKQQ